MFPEQMETFLPPSLGETFPPPFLCSVTVCEPSENACRPSGLFPRTHSVIRGFNKHLASAVC